MMRLCKLKIILFFVFVNYIKGDEEREKGLPLHSEVEPFIDVFSSPGEYRNNLPTVPRLPAGNLQFQLYTLNREGKLQKQWMSLQEIQNIVLSHAVNRHLKIKDLETKVQEFNEIIKKEEEEILMNTFPGKIHSSIFKHQVSKDTSVDDVLANVQKVMSKEVTNNILNKQLENIHENKRKNVSQPKSQETENQLTSTTDISELNDSDLSKENKRVNSPTTSSPEDAFFETDNSYIESTITSIISPYDQLTDAEDVDRTTSIPTSTDNVDTTVTTEANEDTNATHSMNNNRDNTEKKASVSVDHLTDLFGRHPDSSILSSDYFGDLKSLEDMEMEDSEMFAQKSNFSKTNSHNFIYSGHESSPPNNFGSIYSIIKPKNTEHNLGSPQLPNMRLGYKPQNDMESLAGKNSPTIFATANGLVMKSNVLSPSEIGNVPPQNLGQLEHVSNKGHQDIYALDNNPIYLEDIGDVTFDYDQLVNQPQTKNVSKFPTFDFPSPQPTNSYDRPSHLPTRGSTRPTSNVDPTQFLPLHNPTIANRNNPLKKTPFNNVGLMWTVDSLDPEVRAYIEELNNVIFKVYSEAIQIHRRQNLVLSSLNLLSALSMLVLGARSRTAEAFSSFLKTERFRSFNPHLVIKNITGSLLSLNNKNHESALVNSIFVEKSPLKEHSLDFFGRSIDFFYNAIVKQVEKENIGEAARDLANDLIRKRTNGVVKNFLKPNSQLKINGPLSSVSSAYFQMNWDLDIKSGDLTDMSFIRFPSAERRLVRTVGISKKMTIKAGYSDQLDVTVAEVPVKSSQGEISLLLVMPGQQKDFIANGLVKFEKSLTADRWNQALRAVIPHRLNLKMPIFSHRNYLNLTGILAKIGLGQPFTESADFSGINGAKNLHLGDVIQLCEFHSCKLDLETLARSTTENEHMRTHLSTGGIEIKENVKMNRMGTAPDQVEGTLAFDRAFLYVLRHNPTGLILYIGRYLDPETF